MMMMMMTTKLDINIITGTFVVDHTEFTEGNVQHFSFEHTGVKKVKFIAYLNAILGRL